MPAMLLTEKEILSFPQKKQTRAIFRFWSKMMEKALNKRIYLKFLIRFLQQNLLDREQGLVFPWDMVLLNATREISVLKAQKAKERFLQ